MWQTQTWTGHHKSVQSMLCRVLVGFCDAFDAPVRCAKRADAPARLLLIQFLDYWTHLHGFIITMQKIQVNKICVQSLQTFTEVSLKCLGCDARYPGTAEYIVTINPGMTTLCDQYQFIPASRFLDPPAESFFAVTKAIDMCCINTIPAGLKKSFKQLSRAVISIWRKRSRRCSESND